MGNYYFGRRRPDRFRKSSYLEPHPLAAIADDWPNRDALDAECKIIIYAFEGTPENIDDMDAYVRNRTDSRYGHIVEITVEGLHGYLVKDQFSSRQEAVEFARDIQEPVGYDDLIDMGFQFNPYI